MNSLEKKDHWERVYTTKALEEVSWYQPRPATSLEFLKELGAQPDHHIIDIGGGDSLLVDHLLEQGFSNVTVLDISEAAIERAVKRLGEKANRVQWIVADASNFHPTKTYDFWHDRAAFHFLTEAQDIDRYLNSFYASLSNGGKAVFGTFAESGPTQCSGLTVQQYSGDQLAERIGLEKIKCVEVDHFTPAEKVQHFTFCSFKK